MQNCQKAYTDALANLAPAGSQPRKVAACQTFELHLANAGVKRTKVASGLKNRFDRDPPYTNLTSNFSGGYDVSYSDPLGRFCM
jgi:iron complex outermembrane receptor protein